MESVKDTPDSCMGQPAAVAWLERRCATLDGPHQVTHILMPHRDLAIRRLNIHVEQALG